MLKSVLRLFVLLSALTLLSHLHGGLLSEVQAARKCPTCTNEVHDHEIAEGKAVACSNGQHAMHGECAVPLLHSAPHLTEMQEDGEIKCCECRGTYSWDEVQKQLPEDAKAEIKVRLEKEKTPENRAKTEFEIQRLIVDIEEAFNLSCPINGCGGALDRVNGCNEATCGSCNSKFCNLCHKAMDNTSQAQEHLKGHSAGPYEMRPGYIDRYHWLLSREKLAHVFSRRVTRFVRRTALETDLIKKLLQEKKMWPMPAGIFASKWLKEVDSANLPKDQMIELLQNEFIFLHRKNQSENAAAIQKRLFELGAKVLESLDVGDERGLHPKMGETELIPVHSNDERVPRRFSAVGKMVQVGDMIFSGVLKKKGSEGKDFADLTQPEASDNCKKLGENVKLPSVEDYQKFAAAQGKKYGTTEGPDHYRPEGFVEHTEVYQGWFWTRDMDPKKKDKAYQFNAMDGTLDPMNIMNHFFARCVIYLNRF